MLLTRRHFDNVKAVSFSYTTMFRFFSRDDLRRPQWLLLWMFPYLVFSVWASPLHSHTSDGREIALPSLVNAPQSSTRSDSAQVEKAATHIAGECFLCDWNASASSTQIAVASFVLPIERTQTVAFGSSQSPRFCRARVSRNRGPPSPLFFS